MGNESGPLSRMPTASGVVGDRAAAALVVGFGHALMLV